MPRSCRFLFLSFLLMAPCALAQGQKQQSPAKQQEPPDETNPPEEDESLAPKKYVLNPLEAKRNIMVGDEYFKGGHYQGALSRYLDATRYNPRSAEAFLKLGEAQEKLHNSDKAKTAFQKVIQLAPDSKFAEKAKKKLESIKG